MARGQQLLDDTGNAFGQANPQPVRLTAGALGGAKSFHGHSAANNNWTIVKASPGVVWSVQVLNVAATARYFRFGDFATGVHVGSAVVYQVPLPASMTVPAVVPFPAGLAFLTGISFWCVSDVSDGGGTAIGANEVFWDGTYA